MTRKPLNNRTDAAQRRKKQIQQNAMVRVLSAAAMLALIVLLSVGLTGLLQPTDNAAVSAAWEQPVHDDGAPTPVPTPSPEPTITPTPAVYAPFGAQYGYGGADLIPETPTPSPTARALVTPAPTAAPTAAITAAPQGNRTLKKGMTGEGVRRLQQMLIALNYLNGAADGDFGANTQDAVMMFQAVNSLAADGIAGERTLTLLYSGSALDASHAPKTDSLILINRKNAMGKGYVPTDLVSIESILPASLVKVKYANTKANRIAVEALGEMLRAAQADGLSDFQISSAYRTFAEQQKLVDNSVSKFLKNNPGWSRDRALSATYQTVAPAGTSEHQSGLAFDITVPNVSFGGTPQQIWLHEHCVEYGFVVRFTKDKQDITGFLAESWHFRYVGKEAAAVMTQNNWCLEEYVERMGK